MSVVLVLTNSLLLSIIFLTAAEQLGIATEEKQLGLSLQFLRKELNCE